MAASACIHILCLVVFHDPEVLNHGIVLRISACYGRNYFQIGVILAQGGYLLILLDVGHLVLLFLRLSNGLIRGVALEDFVLPSHVEELFTTTLKDDICR